MLIYLLENIVLKNLGNGNDQERQFIIGLNFLTS